MKYIAGVAYADARIDAIDVAMSADKWSVREQGEMFTTDAIDIQYKPNGEIDDISKGSFGVAGNGLGFDFGASYKLLDNLVLSASLTDVGFVAWKGSNASVDPDEFVYDGFHHLVAEKDPDGSSALSREGDQLEEDLRNWCGSRMRLEQVARSRCKRCSTLPVNIQSSMINRVRIAVVYTTRNSSQVDRGDGFCQLPSGAVVQCNGQLLNVEPRTFIRSFNQLLSEGLQLLLWLGLYSV